MYCNVYKKLIRLILYNKQRIHISIILTHKNLFSDLLIKRWQKIADYNGVYFIK